MALHCPFFPKELFDTKNSREHARTYSCVSDIIFVDAKIRKKAGGSIFKNPTGYYLNFQ